MVYLTSQQQIELLISSFLLFILSWLFTIADNLYDAMIISIFYIIIYIISTLITTLINNLNYFRYT